MSREGNQEGGVTAVSHGLIIINTGDGKGKTTAALGLALRALGHGMRVAMIQFIKSDARTGEHRMAERLGPSFTLKAMGVGFVFDEWSEQDIAAAREAWDTARDITLSGDADVVILDEITYCIREDIIPVAELLDLLARRPAGMHVVLTGRDAPPELLEVADLVTDMQCTKHPFAAGIRAQRGVEF